MNHVMNNAILTERLVRHISRYGREALTGRQVCRRLDVLLPQRLRELKADHARRVQQDRAPSNRAKSERIQAKAERCALTDARYLGFIDEITSIHGDALLARVQYETHVMLFEARRSLRLFKR